MWIMHNKAFISIVAPKVADFARAKNEGALPPNASIKTYLSVRARNSAHLKALFPDAAILAWPARDYQFRAFVIRADAMKAISNAVAAIEYTNFKDSVKSNALHDAYMQVWSVMNRYGHGVFNPKTARRTKARNATFSETLDPYGDDAAFPWDDYRAS